MAIIPPGVAMTVSTMGINLAAWAAALVASTGLFVLGPFSQPAPSHTPPSPMEVVCSSIDLSDPSAAPVLGGCLYQGRPVAVLVSI